MSANHKMRAEDIAKEYQDFAYIVSHDLSAPLRHVKEFTRLLINSRGDTTSQEEREYMEFLERSLSKLETMQEALLHFSRLNTRVGASREIDVGVLLGQILEKFAPLINEKGAYVSCDAQCKITAEPQQAHTLFAHLIDNALKFHAKDAKPSISITAQVQSNDILIAIEDNGIGIPPELRADVFKLFRRLHQPADYPGIGAGLTIAHKIVQRHGGEIWIETGKNEQGTRVCISWPRA